MWPHSSTAGTFRKKFQKNSGKTPETLSERFLESRVLLGSPKPYNSKHLRLPEHFQNSLFFSTAEEASTFKSGSGEGLSELVMAFPAVLRLFLKKGGFGEYALVPVFGTKEHPNVPSFRFLVPGDHPLGNHPHANPRKMTH